MKKDNSQNKNSSSAEIQKTSGMTKLDKTRKKNKTNAISRLLTVPLALGLLVVLSYGCYPQEGEVACNKVGTIYDNTLGAKTVYVTFSATDGCNGKNSYIYVEDKGGTRKAGEKIKLEDKTTTVFTVTVKAGEKVRFECNGSGGKCKFKVISIVTEKGIRLLTIGCQDEPKTLNIWKATDVWSVHACAWFYPSLYYRTPVTLEPIPDMCTLTLDELYANSP